MKCKTCKKVDVEDIKYFHCEACRTKRREKLEAKKQEEAQWEIKNNCIICGRKLNLNNTSSKCSQCKTDEGYYIKHKVNIDKIDWETQGVCVKCGKERYNGSMVCVEHYNKLTNKNRTTNKDYYQGLNKLIGK